MTVLTERLELKDAKEAAALEELCFGAEGWSLGDIEDTLRSLKGRYQDMEGRNTLEEDTQSHLEDDGEER